jgi:hypothetical protein
MTAGTTLYQAVGHQFGTRIISEQLDRLRNHGVTVTRPLVPTIPR